MVSRADVDRFLAHPTTPDSPVLSVYLDVDQSRAVNLNREFLAALKARLREVEHRLPEADRDAFRADAARVTGFVAHYQPRAKALVVFADDSAGLFWTGELRAPLPTEVRWAPRPYLRPLVELLDEYDRYGVILVDKERARVFTVFLGEIEEERDALAAAEVRHKRASGTDHLRSQMNFQRQDDVHVQWHLRHVAELAGELAGLHSFDRLVLAGPVEVTSELGRLLPRPLAERVVASIRLPFEAPADDVLRETLAVEQRVEREEEKERVAQLFDGLGGRATIGLGPTLAALQERRVWVLLYADGLTSGGGECPRCGALFPDGTAACAYCSETVRPLEDLVERAIERTAEAGGEVEPVRGEAATRLRNAGGIGALLRF